MVPRGTFWEPQGVNALIDKRSGLPNPGGVHESATYAGESIESSIISPPKERCCL